MSTHIFTSVKMLTDRRASLFGEKITQIPPSPPQSDPCLARCTGPENKVRSFSEQLTVKSHFQVRFHSLPRQLDKCITVSTRKR